MIRSRLALEAVGLCVLVLGLMGFAASAQAETGAKWRVGGVDVGSLEPKLAVSSFDSKTLGLLYVTKSGVDVLIKCETLGISEGGALIANGGISLGRVSFGLCSVFLNGVAATKCEAHSPGRPNGSILSERGKGLIVLDKEAESTSELVKLTPENEKGETSKLLAVVEFGEFCSVGETIKVEAKELGEGLWLGGGTGFATEGTSHLILEGLSNMRVLGQTANFVGSVFLELNGVHKGLKWSGVPA